MSKQFKSIKIGVSSKEAAIRAAMSLNKRCFESKLISCHGSEVREGQYVTTLFVEDNQEVKDAHIAAVHAWDTVLRHHEERETLNKH